MLIKPDLTYADHFVETPHGRMFARAWTPFEPARGAPIVLIHDSLGCVELWRDFPQKLSASTQRQIIAYDRLGFGRSDPRSDALRASFVREEAQIYMPHLLRYFQIERFVPFGHSVGGGMAICCGADLPGACVAVVTESAQMFAEDRTLHAIAAAKIEYAKPERFEKLQRYHGAKTSWVLRAWTDTWLSAEFASFSVRQELRTLQCPLLALHGEFDEFGSLEHLRVARDLSVGAVTTRELAGLGHVPHREAPQLVLQAVTQFIANI